MKLQSYSEEFMAETQNGFRKGRSCTYPILCLKLLIKKRSEYNLETRLLFIDYEKAFDIVQIRILFDILKSRNIPDILLNEIVDITHTKLNVNKIQLQTIKPS
jgi:hypothetical protein